MTTKLDILRLARNTRNTSKVAQCIRVFFPAFRRESEYSTLLAFALHSLDLHTRKEFFNNLGLY